MKGGLGRLFCFLKYLWHMRLIGIFILLSWMAGQAIVVAQPAPPGAPPIVITEIMYHPPGTSDTLEYIELMNPSDSTQRSVGAYFFTSGIEYTFPVGTILDPLEIIVVANDSVAFENTFNYPAFQWHSGNLDNNGELLLLKGFTNETSDSVHYQPGAPWPDASGNGHSIVLCDRSLDNSLAQNWQQANNNTGIELAGETIFASPATDCSGWISIYEAGFSDFKIYPNPNRGRFFIELPEQASESFIVSVHDLSGKLVNRQMLNPDAENQIVLDLQLSTGTYLIVLESNGFKLHQRLLIME